jgi:hypothetical protein
MDASAGRGDPICLVLSRILLQRTLSSKKTWTLDDTAAYQLIFFLIDCWPAADREILSLGLIR